MNEPVNSLGPDTLDLPGASEQLRREGYALFKAAVEPALCEETHASIIAAFRQFRTDLGRKRIGGIIHGHLNCYPGAQSKKVASLVEELGITELMSQYLGRPVMLTSVGCNINLPGSHTQNYHIDGEWSSPFFIVNISLIETSKTNGSIELTPGTHRQELKYWRFLTSGLWRKGARCDSGRGDIIVRLSTLWHRGMPNRSSRMRPMIGLVYGVREPGTPAFDFTRNSGEITFMANRFGPDFRGLAAELLSTYLPALSVPSRFIKSMLAGRKGSPARA